MIGLPECHRWTPWRPLDWRWRRAQHLAEQGLCCLGWDDVSTGEALKFIQGSAHCTTPEQRDRLRQQLPAIAEAHRVHLNDDLTTWRIQARILARQEIPEVARLVGLAPKSIETYEALFYDIRQRHDAACCVHKLALRRPATHEPQAGWLAWLLRTLGYCGGVVVLDLAEPALASGKWSDPRPAPSKTEDLSPLDVLAEKFRLLATLLTIPEDCPASRVLTLMAELSKSTWMEGTDVLSPLTDFVDELMADGAFKAPPGGNSAADLEPGVGADDDEFGESDVERGGSESADDASEADRRRDRETA